jgi:hypothetical protein
MSLFTDILASIGGEPVPQPAQPPARRPASAPTGRPSDDLTKPTARLGINEGSNVTNGLKRKAEDALGTTRDGKPASTKPAYAGTMSKPSASGQATQRPRTSAGKHDGKPTSRPTTPADSTATNPPAKGSYAEIIARAKAAQEERGTNQVGMIKHQKEQREKVSYLAQRKAGNEEARAKAEKLDKLKNRPVVNGRIDKRARSNSPMKRPTTSSLKSEKPLRERAPRPAYSGTMRTSASKPRAKPRPARRPDEYLGTDEEDNSDNAELEDYPSDESEDMEAGAFAIDEEEQAAARAAKMEDAKEAALEKKLKADKEERRRKLEAMSKKAPGRKY